MSNITDLFDTKLDPEVLAKINQAIRERDNTITSPATSALHILDDRAKSEFGNMLALTLAEALEDTPENTEKVNQISQMFTRALATSYALGSSKVIDIFNDSADIVEIGADAIEEPGIAQGLRKRVQTIRTTTELVADATVNQFDFSDL